MEEDKATEEVQQQTQEETQPLEDLQARLEEIKAEKERYENLYKKFQREQSSIDEQKRQLGQRAEILDTIPSLAQRLDSIEEYNAMMADYLEELRGTQGIETPPVRRSHLDELRQRREQKVEPKKEPEVPAQDPEELRAAVQAQVIIEEMGWDMEHPAVKKTLHLADAREALKTLKKEQKAQIEREKEEAVQQELKKRGLTTNETGGPSGASLDDDAFMLKYSKGESDDHARAQEILKKLK